MNIGIIFDAHDEMFAIGKSREEREKIINSNKRERRMELIREIKSKNDLVIFIARNHISDFSSFNNDDERNKIDEFEEETKKNNETKEDLSFYFCALDNSTKKIEDLTKEDWKEFSKMILWDFIMDEEDLRPTDINWYISDSLCAEKIKEYSYGKRIWNINENIEVINL